MYLQDAMEVIGGTPQFRIVEDVNGIAPVYTFYTQADLECDLKGVAYSTPDRKRIRTNDKVLTVATDDVIFSLLSGTATMVRVERSGFLLTQNYVLLENMCGYNARYLVYLLNEDKVIRRQLAMGRQGTSTMKYTIRQLAGLELPSPPPLEVQQRIGDVYFDQLKVEALKMRVAELETKLVFAEIERAVEA